MAALLDIITLGMYFFALYFGVFWLLIYLRGGEERKTVLRGRPPITILIPAYNEESKISRAIDSCIRADYPNNKKQILVINDGSTDRTADVCRKYVKSGKITLINKPNGGKASALNLGLKRAKGEFVITLDSDSFIDRNAIRALLSKFNNKNVAAVTANMQITEPKTWVQKVQWVEYILSIYARKVLGAINAQYVLPGPGSTYRRDMLLNVGGWDENNLTEDMEMALRIINKYDVEIENAQNAFVYTESPKTFGELTKQRMRWYAGYCHNVIKYDRLVFNPRKSQMSMLLVPINAIWPIVINFFVFQFLYGQASLISRLIRDLALVKYSPLPMSISIPDLPLYFNYPLAFSLIFFLMGVMVLYAGLKLGRIKFNLLRNIGKYALYFLLYMFMFSFFWMAALVYFVGGSKKWQGK